jgi:hypothetical protein
MKKYHTSHGWMYLDGLIMVFLFSENKPYDSSESINVLLILFVRQYKSKILLLIKYYEIAKQ